MGQKAQRGHVLGLLGVQQVQGAQVPGELAFSNGERQMGCERPAMPDQSLDLVSGARGSHPRLLSKTLTG